uniref:Uncharacterized protein n=1 Tax=Anguilla anguilla TaxID=7936 RepID=A0A0E9W979_ANGAN
MTIKTSMHTKNTSIDHAFYIQLLFCMKRSIVILLWLIQAGLHK